MLRLTSPGGSSIIASSTTKCRQELLGAAARRLPATPTSADILEGVWALNGDDLGGLTAPLRFKRDAPTVPSVCYWQVVVADNSYKSPDNGQRYCEHP